MIKKVFVFFCFSIFLFPVSVLTADSFLTTVYDDIIEKEITTEPYCLKYKTEISSTSSQKIDTCVDWGEKEYYKYFYTDNKEIAVIPYQNNNRAIKLDNNTVGFYAEPQWGWDTSGKIKAIKTATTSYADFNALEYKPLSWLNNFIDVANASTTSYTVSSTYTPPCAGNASILVVAGGGGGGNGAGAGGGAGGFLYVTTTALTVQSYTITVGVGGKSPDPAVGGAGGNGGNSVFGPYTAIGGGGGGGSDGANAGGSGGSGGGGSYAGAVGTGTTGQGYDGGAGGGNPNWRSGGGGGAGAIGGASSGTTGGKGGDGRSTMITGVSTTYAGGGSAFNGGAGGLGGGGAFGFSGSANTGGGAGGVDSAATYGGSGIVIVSFDQTQCSSPVVTTTVAVGLFSYFWASYYSVLYQLAGVALLFALVLGIIKLIKNWHTWFGSNF